MSKKGPLAVALVGIGGALLQDAIVSAIEERVAIEARRLQIPYWVVLGGVALILLVAAE